MTESSGGSDRGDDAASVGSGKKGPTTRTTTRTTAHATGAGTDTTTGGRSLGVARVRTTVARIVWLACLLIALVLAAAAFSYALEANIENNLVKAVRDLAEIFDIGLFDIDNPVWAADPDEPNAIVKTALANYGAAAVGYLIVGRLLERIIRP